MQIEKVNNYKIKVILNANDLEENNIDLNTFMANSLESQELFLDILDLAEEEFNFYVDNSKLVIECISLSNHIFIFTITKLLDCKDSNSEYIIYCFNNFDELASIFEYIKNIDDFNVYTYNNKLYLTINKYHKSISIIDEFCSSKISSDNLYNVLNEHGQKCCFN